MTTFKKRESNRGAALIWALVLGTIGLIISVGIITTSVQQTAITQKSKDESTFIMTAHAVAALLKQEILKNFDDRFNKDEVGSWTTCREPSSNPATAPYTPSYVSNYVWALKDPDANDANNNHKARSPVVCATQSFHFTSFKTTAVVPATYVTLSNLTTTQFRANDNLNNFSATSRIVDINTARNQLVADLVLSRLPAAGPGLAAPATTRSVKLAIDVGRTLNPADRDNKYQICRTVPGAVCRPGLPDGPLLITYLDSSGRIMNVTYDPVLASPTTPTENMNQTPAPTAVSVKNVNDSAKTKTEYTNNSWKVPGISTTDPVVYVIDAALGKKDPNSSEKLYFLTTHGNIIDQDNNEIAVDPKLTSISYEPMRQKWYLLRSDGQVLETPVLSGSPSPTDEPTSTPVSGLLLPTAEKLTLGAGPDPAKSETF